MPTLKKSDFFESDTGKDVREKLLYMMSDTSFNTESVYTADSVKYPDNQMPFVDRHMNYLKIHPQLDVWTYIANIRLMTRLR